MKNLNEVYILSKNHLSDLDVEGINIELENSSIILYAGKKEIGSSIRIYNSKKENYFIYCYGNFQTEIGNENIESKIKDDLEKLKEAFVSNKYKSPLTQFLNQQAQQRIKEVNETKVETATEKIDANKLDNKNFSELLHKNLDEHKEKQKIELEEKLKKQKDAFDNKVNMYFYTIQKKYRESLLNQTKRGFKFTSFDFQNNIQNKKSGQELINNLEDYNSYKELISLLEKDNLDYSFEVKESLSDRAMHFMATDDIDYSSANRLDDSTNFYLHFHISIKD